MADQDSLTRGAALKPDIMAYVNRLHARHDEHLERAYTAADRDHVPDIHVSAQEGKLLEVLLRLVGAKKVVEVGTLAGYSAIRMARGLAAGGKVWTIEFLDSHAEVAKKNVEVAGLGGKIEVITGDARTVLADIAKHGPFDAVFVDADKESYHHYEKWAAEHLRSGGLFIADNAFLFGELLAETDRAHAMRACHEQASKHFETLCIPTPDGLLVGIKP